jgi:hypothetical protein
MIRSASRQEIEIERMLGTLTFGLSEALTGWQDNHRKCGGKNIPDQGLNVLE